MVGLGLAGNDGALGTGAGCVRAWNQVQFNSNPLLKSLTVLKVVGSSAGWGAPGLHSG